MLCLQLAVVLLGVVLTGHVHCAPDPPNLQQLSCAVRQFAYQFGMSKVSSNPASLSAALRLSNCSSSSSSSSSSSVPSLPRHVPPTPLAYAQAEDYAMTVYVSISTGSDSSGDGSKANPFATLHHAQSVLRASPAARPAAVVIRAGEYVLSSTLTLSSQDSNVAWQAYPGETVTISSSYQLPSPIKWTPVPAMKGVYSVPVSLPTPLPPPPTTSDPLPCHTVQGVDLDGNDVGSVKVSSVADCCAACSADSRCEYFTFWQGHDTCWKKSSMAGYRPFSSDHFSGSPTHVLPPLPSPSPAPSPLPPSPVNQLFVGDQRQIRARYPNGNPADLSGICFSRPQVDGEGCNGYIQASGGSGTMPSPASSYTLSFGLNRGDSPTFGCDTCAENWGTFRYHVYPYPPNHPVYDAPLYGSGFANMSLFSFWGSPFSRSSSFTSATPFPRNWSDPSTAVVHMFHSALWGGWQYRVSNRTGDNQLDLAYGGFQEARGSAIKTNHFYVENVLEELDAPGEYFYDAKASLLYFMPNGSLPSSGVGIPMLDTLVGVNGTTASASSSSGGAQPVRNVSLTGLTFTGTRATYFRMYEVPSGGDWSVHRGAAVELEMAEDIRIEACNFTQLGGNAVLLSNHVTGAAIVENEFLLLGDSAIVAMGRTDGVFGTAATYPNNNLVANNHIHDFGLYGKQTSAFFQATTANTTLQDNVMYNGPRAGVNFNDGFGGNNVMQRNLLFNFVRETGDHGPFNSWDRQPYLTYNGVDDGFNATTCPDCPPGSSIIRANDTITKNFIINGYNGVWSIDHDDGSQFYLDIANFMVFGGCKNYLGNSKQCNENVIVHPGAQSRSSGNRRCQTDDNGLFANQFHRDNKCIVQDGRPYTWGRCNPARVLETTYHTAGNQFFLPNFTQTCGSTTFHSLADWQATTQDAGASIAPIPSVADIVAMGKTVLGV